MVTIVGGNRNHIGNVILQLVLLVYLYLVRPFRYGFFNIFGIIMQALVTIFYMYRYTASLYIKISQEVTTSMDINNLLLSNIIILCIIMTLYLILGIYELKHKVRVFRIGMKKWKRETIYALGDAFNTNNQNNNQNQNNNNNNQDRRRNITNRNKNMR